MRKNVLSIGLLVGTMLLAGCGGKGGASGGSGSAIYDAAARGDDAAIREAVAAGTDVDAPGRADRTGLFIAVYNKNVRTAQTLLDLGADPVAADKNGKTPLMYAASRGYNDLLKSMLAKRPNVNAQDKGGYTAAHHAGTMGNTEGLNLLKAAGADMTLRDKVGRTADELAYAKAQQSAVGATAAPAK
jgi:ankyrin repeat protein